MNIGRRIKILRAKKGLTQQQLADLINKTRPLISNIEVSSKVNPYTLNEIAKALDVSIEYLNGDEETFINMVEDPKATYSNLSEKIKQLERENNLLSDIILSQKELIDQLKMKINSKS